MFPSKFYPLFVLLLVAAVALPACGGIPTLPGTEKVELSTPTPEPVIVTSVPAEPSPTPFIAEPTLPAPGFNPMVYGETGIFVAGDIVFAFVQDKSTGLLNLEEIQGQGFELPGTMKLYSIHDPENGLKYFDLSGTVSKWTKSDTEIIPVNIVLLSYVWEKTDVRGLWVEMDPIGSGQGNILVNTFTADQLLENGIISDETHKTLKDAESAFNATGWENQKCFATNETIRELRLDGSSDCPTQ